MKMRLFHIGFDGKALGGSAIVIAGGAESALHVLKKEYGELSNVEVACIEDVPEVPAVIHFWDGDY